MNAYELADQLENVKYQNGAKPFGMYANMLRYQADRIAELEKQLEKTSEAAVQLREIYVNRIAELQNNRRKAKD